MNWVRHGGSTTFETKSSYCRVARQGLLCYTAVARLSFRRRATAVLKSDLIRSTQFGTAVARSLKRALFLVGILFSQEKVPHMCLKINCSVKTPCYMPSIAVARSGLLAPGRNHSPDEGHRFQWVRVLSLPVFIVTKTVAKHFNLTFQMSREEKSDVKFVKLWIGWHIQKDQERTSWKKPPYQKSASSC